MDPENLTLICETHVPPCAPRAQDRLRIEASALREEHAHAPAHVPTVFLYDAPMAVCAMTYIAPPALILRKV